MINVTYFAFSAFSHWLNIAEDFWAICCDLTETADARLHMLDPALNIKKVSLTVTQALCIDAFYHYLIELF